MRNLTVLNATCINNQIENTVRLFNADHDDIMAVNSSGGSVDCIRRMLNHEPCDLLVLADDQIIANMMMPAYTDGYYVFAGNSMVLMPTRPGKSIDSSNWLDVLLDPTTTFGHFDPHGDPGGYRAVLACLLCDSLEQGVAGKLLNHTGRRIVTSHDDSPVDFMFGYRSGPFAKNKPYAELPEKINLSNPKLNEHYATARFDIDGDGKNVVYGSAICHALTIPFTATAPQAALEFVQLFLQTDFVAAGFLPRSRTVGCWPPQR